ncbi:MAG: glutamate--tRNA ligase [Bacilli bacterium]|nr:glutamate--tRNA ligase [Bacilli bacterium]
MADLNELAELLFPDVTKTIADLEKEYPARNLPEGAEVTRFAPSPTGFLHTGSLFTALIGYTIAKQSGGVFYFRLEDTDTKRTIAGSADELISQLAVFGIKHDEGYFPNGDEGKYGPYQQSKRRDIYRTVIKELIRRGRAYPDFCTTEDLEKIRAFQEANKILPGYYGVYARDRNLSVDEQIARVKAGTPWVIRYKSQGDHDKKTFFEDAIRGRIDLQDNDVDVVILKSDGLPTYHFAHVCDDHFMHSTLITRGEEWIPSTPIHLDMFRALGWEAPRYAHLPVIMKLDHGNKRKLSKRKDPEAAVSYFLETGYPPEALLVYLMSIANSNFEEWSIENKELSIKNFTFSLKKMSLDGALFDGDKLNYFSKEIIAIDPVDSILKKVTDWSEQYDKVLHEKIMANPAYFRKILNIEKERAHPRKDYAKYSDIEPLTRFFFEKDYAEIVKNGLPFNERYSKEFLSSLLKDFADKMIYGVDESTWWNSVKEIAGAHGFALSNKEYKANPENFSGSVSDAAEILRIALTGGKESPNLHEIIEILTEEVVKNRLRALA